MVKLLSKLFIKNPTEYADPLVRKAYGTLCSLLGIFLNVLLFAGKYAAGAISGSIAITADAFNNLSDAGASAISLLGFRLSVAALIVVMGVELLISSVDKILSPEPVEVGLLPAAILLASILVKLYMFAYNCSVGKKISSSAMAATGADSLSDSVATAVVLLSMGVSWLFKVNIDGWAGAAVAVFILFAGYGVAKDTLSPLLGQAPDPELVKSIEEIVMSSDAVIGMHDLVVHDYGPGRMMISLHAEVDGRGNIFQLHDSIDTVERKLKSALGCDATIHMDPVETDNEQVNAERAALEEALKGIDGLRGIHDFRMVMGPSHTNLIFDVVMDTGCGKTPEQFRDIICRTVEEKLPGHFAVVTVDTSFVF